MAERTVRVKFTGDAKGLERAAASGSKAIRSWQNDFKKIGHAAGVGLVGVGVAVGAALTQLVPMSRGLEALDVKSKTVFGNQLGRVQKWAEANKAAFGVSGRAAVGMAANMADLLVPMGFTQKAAASMSTTTVGLAGALARWSGGTKSAAEVSEILSAAFLGERDALQSLGISISQSEVDAELAAKGQSKLTGKARQQAEALATQKLILAKSTDAQKAWANGGAAAAAKQNALNVKIAETKEKLAAGLTPAIEKVTGWLLQMATWLEKNSSWFVPLVGILAAVAAVIWLVTAATAAWNAVMLISPVTWIILAIVALIAIIVLIATKTTWFQTLWKNTWKGIQIVASAVGRWFSVTLVGWIKGAWDSIIGAVKKAQTWLLGMPARLWQAFQKIAVWLTAPFRSAFNAISRLWNNTVGKLSFTVPSWVPGIGGKGFSMPKLPTLHQGGIVPGPFGKEVPILAQAGERVLTRAQQRNAGGDTFNVTVKAFSDRFSLKQVMDDLALNGAA